jgi:hypothetical protein
MANTTTNMVDWKEGKGRVFVLLHLCYPVIRGAGGKQAVAQALRYKPEGCGFDSRWCHWIFFIEIILPTAL